MAKWYLSQPHQNVLKFVPEFSLHFFAALLAIVELTSSNVDDEKSKAISGHTNQFGWYQSKSIKQSLQESELNTLVLLMESDMIKADKVHAFNQKAEKIKKEIERYKNEKNEIKDGSANIPKDKWIQELDGKLGHIVGFKEYEKLIEKYEIAESKFDLSKLFFQICLVLGAICVLLNDSPKIQRYYVFMMIGMGTIGCGFGFWGYLLA